MRYQQGIGTPETLGVQPTVWKEPQMFKAKPFSFPTINAGVQGLQGILTKGRGTGETMTSDAGSRTMTRPPTGIVDPAERRGMW